MTMRIAKGDIVRLYGYRGLFRVASEPRLDGVVFNAESVNDSRIWFSAQSASVVERNGEPLPLLSCPIDYPASDYPHLPMFDYSDGPQRNGQDAIDHWQSAQV